MLATTRASGESATQMKATNPAKKVHKRSIRLNKAATLRAERPAQAGAGKERTASKDLARDGAGAADPHRETAVCRAGAIAAARIARTIVLMAPPIRARADMPHMGSTMRAGNHENRGNYARVARITTASAADRAEGPTVP